MGTTMTSIDAMLSLEAGILPIWYGGNTEMERTECEMFQRFDMGKDGLCCNIGTVEVSWMYRG